MSGISSTAFPQAVEISHHLVRVSPDLTFHVEHAPRRAGRTLRPLRSELSAWSAHSPAREDSIKNPEREPSTRGDRDSGARGPGGCEPACVLAAALRVARNCTNRRRFDTAPDCKSRSTTAKPLSRKALASLWSASCGPFALPKTGRGAVARVLPGDCAVGVVRLRITARRLLRLALVVRPNGC